jgi:chromosomal replication initiation ATPase DnaA
VPESKSLAPDMEKIRQVVCKTYGVNEEDLFKAKSLTRQLRGEGLVEICRDYNLKKYSSASSVIERVRKRISKDPQFKKRIDLLIAIGTKSQS